MTSSQIVKVAQSYLNQEEKPGNKGWKDPSFEAKMKAVGWKPTDAWCCYFAELVAKEAFGPGPTWDALDRLFSPNCQATYANFSQSKLFKVGKIAKPGALAVWRMGKTWKGHIGIVETVKFDANSVRVFTCIEGNTNAAGGREGTHVLRKNRRAVWTNGSGLNLTGFIYLV